MRSSGPARGTPSAGSAAQKPPQKPAYESADLEFGDDWLNAVDEWGQRLALPASAPRPAQPQPKPPREKEPEDPLMTLMSGDAEIELTGEGEALGPGLGLEPTQPRVPPVAPTEATTRTPRDKILDQLLALDETAADEFEQAAATRSLPFEEIERLAREQGDFADGDQGGRTKVAEPDEELLFDARRAPPATAVERPRPAAGGRAPALDEPSTIVQPRPGASTPLDDEEEAYAEVAIERSEPVPAPSRVTPSTRTSLGLGAPRPAPGTGPPRTAGLPRVARPLPSPGAGATAPTRPAPIVHRPPPSARMPEAAPPRKPDDDAFELEVEVEGDRFPIRAASQSAPESAVPLPGSEGIEEEITEVREPPARLAAPKPAPLPLAPPPSDRIDLGTEPAVAPPVFVPPPLELGALALPAEARAEVSAAAWDELARLLAAERATRGERAAPLATAEADLLDRLGRSEQADTLLRAAAAAGAAAAPRALLRRALERSDTEEALTWLDVVAPSATASERTALALLRAALQRARGDAAGARASLDRAGPAALVTLGRLELALSEQRHEDALSCLSALVSSDAELLASVRAEQGRLAERLGKDELARAAYDAARTAAAALGPAALGRARVALREHDAAAAAAAFALEAEFTGACAPALRRRAGVLQAATGDPGRGLALLSDLSGALAYETAAELALLAGQPEAAERALGALAEAEPDLGRRAFALLRAGELREASGDADGAAALFEQAAQIAPSVPIRRGIERTSAEHADPDRRIAALSAGADADPARAPLLHTRAARLHEAQGRPAEARAALERALEIEPDFAPALAELSALEAAAGRAAAIGEALARAAAASGKGAGATVLWELAAEAAARAGDGEAAARWLRAAAQGEDAPRALLWALGESDAVLLHTEAERAEEAAFAATLEHRRGWLLTELDPAAAREAFAAAHELSPAHPGPYGALTSLLGHDSRFGDWAEIARNRASALSPRPEAAALLSRAGAALEYEIRDFARALTFYAEADALAPGFGPAREGLLRTARFEGDIDRAAQLLLAQAETVAAPGPRAALLAVAAATLERKGDFSAAAAQYSAALALEPSEMIEHARRTLWRQVGDFSALAGSALDELKAATEPAAKARAYDRLATLDARERGDLPSAALAYENILELDPSHHPSLRALERYFLEEEQTEELIALYGRLVHVLPADGATAVAVHLHRARLRGRTEGATGMLDDAQAATQRDPRCAPALLTLLDDARAHGDVTRTCLLYLLLADAYADDPQAAASCLARVGDGLCAQGRDGEALDRYRAAAELEPGHLGAQYFRLQTALRSEHWPDACAAAEALAATSRRPAHIVEAALLSAIIAEIHLGQLERARAGYQRVLEIEPTNEAAFLRLRRLLETGEQWQELQGLLSARLGGESEPWRVVELHIALANLARLHLSDPDGARQHLAEAVRLHSTNLPALRALTELDWSAGHYKDAVETLIKLAQLEREPMRLRDVFFKLGAVHADHLGDAKKAAAAFGRALRFAPTDREILLRLSDLFLREKDWDNALGTTARLAELETAPAARIQWLMRLADIYRDGFSERRHAAEALRRACEVDPRDLRPVEALANLFAGDVPSKRIHMDRALAALRQALRKDAFDLSAWSALVRIFEWLESSERAHAAAQVLELFGSEGEKTRLLAQMGETFTPLATGLLQPQAQDVLFPGSIPAGFRQLFALLEEPLLKGMRIDPRRYGVDRKNRIGRGHPLHAGFAQMARELPFERDYEVYLSETQKTVCVVEPSDPPMIIVGSELLRGAGPRSVRFLAARTLYLLGTHMGLPARLSPEELGLLLGGIVWQFVPDYVHPNLPQAQLYESAQRVAKLLPRRQRDPVMAFALECSGDLDFGALTQAVQAAAVRAGLLACGHLATAVEVLGRALGLPDPPPRGEALVRACRGKPQIEELLRFLASDELGEIRKVLS